MGLETFGNRRVLLILVGKSWGLKAWVLNAVKGGCLVRGCFILVVLDSKLYELEGTRT